MPGQQMRRSQFITTFGPGALMEGPSGPRVINALDRANIFDAGQAAARDYEITDARLSAGLLGGAGIVRLPSNAELGHADSQAVYATTAFPSWALCVQHRILYKKTNNQDARACPRCPALANRFAAYAQVRSQAIRFVRACAAGHLDDVDWPYVVRVLGGTCAAQGCRSSYFYWRNAGGALRQIQIECPNCGGRANLGTAYARDWPCSGRFPELGLDRPSCTHPSKIIQRGAANLFIPELVSALTIPPRATRLHRILETQAVRVIIQIAAVPLDTKAQMLAILDNLVQRGDLSQSARDEVDSFDEQTILRAIADIRSTPLTQTEATLRAEEFEALRAAAFHGHPHDPTQGRSSQFEVLRDQVRNVAGPSGRLLRVTPVSRLRVVIAQTGYRRLDPASAPVDRVVTIDNREWYPGAELFGEGIFLDLAPQGAEEDSEPMELAGSEAERWQSAHSNPSSFFGTFAFPEQNWLHPAFVWWHTLSHRLLTALSLDCGYSSASLRERVYVKEQANGDFSGGVLIYTAQPGGDGTLGGLVALVPTFERIIARAFMDIDSCSNDPLCSEHGFAPGRVNGAACFACLMQSETSCEHRNMLLDRALVLSNLP
jgi:hypothetical protein